MDRTAPAETIPVRPFAPPPPGRFGFAPCAGAAQGLGRMMLATGRVPAGDLHALHRHRGDEILHVLEGRMLVRLGDAKRICVAGDVVAIPPGTWHAALALTEVALAVVAELGMGTAFAQPGAPDFIEIYRRDIPWCGPPPPGQDWTSDDAMAAIVAAARALEPMPVLIYGIGSRRSIGQALSASGRKASSGAMVLTSS